MTAVFFCDGMELIQLVGLIITNGMLSMYGPGLEDENHSSQNGN